MSKLIDADKLKEALAEEFVHLRKSVLPCEWKNWDKNALLAMETVDNQPSILISCPKCHGKGEYEVAHYEDDELLDCVEIWESRHCELCYGTGKVTVEFYESIQKRCRK